MHWLLAVGTGALIGWLTNWLAIRMLFWPRMPWGVPGTSLCYQGILPRRRAELARLVGVIVEEELLAPQWIAEQVLNEQAPARIVEEVSVAVRAGLHERMPTWIGQSVGPMLLRLADRIIRQELHRFFDQNLDRLMAGISRDLAVADLVEQQINRLDLEEVERITLRLASQELRFIVVLGAVLGAVVGLLQAVLWRFMI